MIAALSFQSTDYVPLFDTYWGITVQRWREREGLPVPEGILLGRDLRDPFMNAYYGVDLVIVSADDTFFPSRAQFVGDDGQYRIVRDGWGRVIRLRNDGIGTTIDQTIAVALPDKFQLDDLRFESPYDDSRYLALLAEVECNRTLPGGGACTMCRIGGPFLRCSWLRGEQQFLIDIAEDPEFVYQLVSRVVDHGIAVGLESLQRGLLHEIGIGIFDDIAHNGGLFMSPRSYERLFLPHLARMVTAFKEAGATRVMYHSDGDIRAMLDAFVDISIDAINPLEPRAGMDVISLRQRYGNRLAFVGGLCNTRVIPNGTNREVREHVLRVLSIAGEGGLVIGSHTIGGDIVLDRYEFVHSLLAQHGRRPRPGQFPSWTAIKAANYAVPARKRGIRRMASRAILLPDDT